MRVSINGRKYNKDRHKHNKMTVLLHSRSRSRPYVHKLVGGAR